MIVKVGVEASNQYEAMKYLAQMAKEAGFVGDDEAFLRALLEREREGTTGIGHGVAIPHGKCQTVRQTGIMICRLTKEIPWRAIDDKPIGLIIGIAVADTSTPDEHLNMISKLARAMISPGFLEGIKASRDPEEIQSKVMEVMR